MINRIEQLNWSNGRTSDPVQAEYVPAEFASHVKIWVRENPPSAFVAAIAAGFVIGLLTKVRK